MLLQQGDILGYDFNRNKRVEQFIRLRDLIEERASRKFFEEQALVDP
jgi:hypothetical protein